MTELPIDSPELSEHEKQVQRIKELSALIVRSKGEIASMPRKALIKAAWQGLANFHGYIVPGSTYDSETGKYSPEVQVVRDEVDLRLSALTEEEHKIAVDEANSWLDDNLQP